MGMPPPGPPPGPAPGPAPGGMTGPGPGAPGPAPGGPGGPPGGAGGPVNEQQLMQGVINLGQQMEQTLMSFSQAMPEGARFFQQASELIKQGIAASIAASGQGEQPPAMSPTSTGPAPFAGGGFSSAGRP